MACRDLAVHWLVRSVQCGYSQPPTPDVASHLTTVPVTDRDLPAPQPASQPATGLLVSVRNAAEAIAALAGGADVVDIKEPLHGPLGRAERATIQAIAQAVGPETWLTAAAGELLECESEEFADWVADLPVGMIKFGLAGCGRQADWPRRLRQRQSQLMPHQQLVAVAYADWQAATAPTPESVLQVAGELGLGWLLVDTYDKQAGDLLAYLPAERLSDLLALAKKMGPASGTGAGIEIVLAGSLRGESLQAVAGLLPRLVGVRGAVCKIGRTGLLSQSLIVEVKATLATKLANCVRKVKKS